MTDRIKALAAEIFDRMATVCDCDADGSAHASECEITAAREAAYDAAEAQVLGVWGPDTDPEPDPFADLMSDEFAEAW